MENGVTRISHVSVWEWIQTRSRIYRVKIWKRI